ncbi:MAG: alpha/beta hydrolase [Bacteroidia bacterium]|nr:alpha/beta hydrolase [Bacteroidia bacterium]
MKNSLILWLSLFVIFPLRSQTLQETGVSLTIAAGKVHGTLTGDSKLSPTVALIISGSGPTDRNGNNPMMSNNSLKMLAEGLSKNGIASLRYDKRGLGESKIPDLKEKDLRFEDFVSDASDWVKWLKNEKKFQKVIIIGHSEGSLIGMLAAGQAGADGYISLAGAGQRADKILYGQIGAQSALLAEYAKPVLDSLAMGKTVEKYNPMLASLFRQEVQPYLISWFQYTPQDEIRKLKIPVMIVQGTTDIQVAVSEAKLLKAAKPEAKLLIIKEMNHVLKKAPENREQNIATYSNTDLPVIPALITKVSKFCKTIQ